MPGQRHRNLLRARRRRGEDEEGAAGGDVIDDSQSEASVPTDNEEDGDADDSDSSEADVPDSKAPRPLRRVNGVGNIKGGKGPETVKSGEATASAAPATASFSAVKDTEAMMNGLKITDEAAKEEAVDFENLGQTGVGEATQNRQESFAERRRREHEEYKKRRDADPAFIPNRGAFFMHDQRSAGLGQNGVGPMGRGRGRGRGGIGGPFSPASIRAQAAEATNDPWKHDLHETLNEAAPKPGFPSIPQGPASKVVSAAPPSTTANAKDAPPNRSFSSTRTIGKIQIRVSLPGMDAPVTFSEAPVRQHTRLPNHRPPLRRDKPVRISLPDCPVRYIFPSTERSFIFIPRAQRPNQQAFGRGRGRAFGSVAGYSSRRTSAYGGSVYSPSVGMSRRSSLAGQYGREGLISPTGSVLSRAPGGFDARPVVRLPPGSQQHSLHGTPIHSAVMSGAGTPVIGMPAPPQSYPLPQKPTFRENWSGPIPMHQPRPQKNVSVSGIESPESLTFHAPQQQEQAPFHQQVPAHINNRATSPDQYPHSRQASSLGQPTVGTPLSNIPERAIHAQPFQPYQQGFQPQGYHAQSAYYYPPPQNGQQPQYPAGAVIAPMFMPHGQNGAYLVPAVAASVPAPAPAQPAGAGQPGMLAQEANGMVYYYDPSQMYQAPPMEGYAGPSYAMPGMGGMMTPTPDGFYYPQVPQGTVYYQPQ